MATLKINAPDGKVLSIDVPQGTDPSKYDSIVDDVMKDYQGGSSSSDAPSMGGSFARGAMSGIPGAEAAVSGVQALGDKTYEQAHQGLETAKDADWETNPWSYGVGKTAGMIGTAMAAPATIPGAIGVGALSGLDAATTPGEIPGAVAMGAGTGAVLGKAGQVIGDNVVKPLVDKFAPSAAKGLLASLGDKTTVSDIEEYLKRSGAINNASTKAEIAEQIAKVTGEMGTASKQLSGQARGLLNPEVAPLSVGTADQPNALQNVINSAGSKYQTLGGPATTADQTALNTLSAQYDRLAALAKDGNIPETDLRTMVDRLQAEIKDTAYGSSQPGSQDALKTLSGKLNDVLRQSNPEYAAAMKPSAEAANMSKDLQDTFKIDPLTGKATDATFGKVGSVLKEGKTEGLDLLGKIKDMTGQDLVQALKDAQVQDNFTSGGSGSAMKTLMASLGFGIGKMTGIPFGGIGGAAAGRFSAEGVNGGQVAKNILDLYMGAQNKWSTSAMKPLVQKFGPILANAAKVGGGQLAATHFVLSTSNPEYQKLTQHLQDENQ